MKILLLSLALFLFQFVSGQERIVRTIMGFNSPYTMADNQIYEDTTVNPSKLVATVRGNKIFARASTNENDVLYTVVGEKVYKSAVTVQSNLIFYVEDQLLFLVQRKVDLKWQERSKGRSVIA